MKVSEEGRRLGTWVILGLLVAQVLIVPWHVFEYGVHPPIDAYAPIFAPPNKLVDASFPASIRMGRLCVQLAVTVGVLVAWRVLTASRNRRSTGVENNA